jgi:S2P endopeptidase
MASSAADPEPWSSYLRSPQNEVLDLGWCVEDKHLSTFVRWDGYRKLIYSLGLSTKQCCLPDEPIFASLSCFVANTESIRLGCLNPVPILTSTDDGTRCASQTDCKVDFVCARPAEKENLLRLTARESEQESDKVVLWTGPRGEIWDGGIYCPPQLRRHSDRFLSYCWDLASKACYYAFDLAFVGESFLGVSDQVHKFTTGD